MIWYISAISASDYNNLEGQVFSGRLQTHRLHLWELENGVPSIMMKPHAPTYSWDSRVQAGFMCPIDPFGHISLCGVQPAQKYMLLFSFVFHSKNERFVRARFGIETSSVIHAILLLGRKNKYVSNFCFCNSMLNSTIFCAFVYKKRI